MNIRRVKTWLIPQGDAHDALWLSEQGITAHYNSESIPFAVGNQTYYVKGTTKLTAETWTEEQELMLKLKFAPNIVLMSDVAQQYISQFDE